MKRTFQELNSKVDYPVTQPGLVMDSASISNSTLTGCVIVGETYAGGTSLTDYTLTGDNSSLKVLDATNSAELLACDSSGALVLKGNSNPSSLLYKTPLRCLDQSGDVVFGVSDTSVNVDAAQFYCQNNCVVNDTATCNVVVGLSDVKTMNPTTSGTGCPSYDQVVTMIGGSYPSNIACNSLIASGTPGLVSAVALVSTNTVGPGLTTTDILCGAIACAGIGCAGIGAANISCTGVTVTGDTSSITMNTGVGKTTSVTAQNIVTGNSSAAGMQCPSYTQVSNMLTGFVGNNISCTSLTATGTVQGSEVVNTGTATLGNQCPNLAQVNTLITSGGTGYEWVAGTYNSPTLGSNAAYSFNVMVLPGTAGYQWNATVYFTLVTAFGTQALSISINGVLYVLNSYYQTTFGGGGVFFCVPLSAVLAGVIDMTTEVTGGSGSYVVSVVYNYMNIPLV